MKKVLYLGLLLGLVAGVSSGCTGGATEKAGQPAQPAPVEPKSSSSKAVTNVTFWHVQGGVNGKSLEAITEKYNNTVGKERGIKVTPVYQGEQLIPKVKTVVQAKDTANMPDIALVQGQDLTYMKNLSYLVWADDLMKKHANGIQKKDIFPNSLESVSYQNRLMGVPFSNSSILLYYNKDMFKQAGLNPDKPPATIAELAEYTSKLTVKKGDTIERYGLVLVPDRWHISNWIGMMDSGRYLGNNEGGRSGNFTEVVFGEEGTMKRFLTEYEKLAKSGGLQYIDNNQREEFLAGKHAMIVQSSSRISGFTDSAKGKFDLGVAVLPKVDQNSNGGVAIGGGALYVFNRGNNENADAAWDFINYAASPETQLAWHKETGYIPVHTGTYKLPEMEQHLKDKPFFKVPIDNLTASNKKVQEPFDPNPTELSTIYKEVILQLVEKKLNVDQAVNEMVNRSNTALKNYYRANPGQ